MMLVEKIEIVDVQVVQVRNSQGLGLGSQGERWIDIEITIRNLSERTAYYFVSSIRSLNFDAATHTLLLGLAEPEQILTDEQARGLVSLPEIQEISPKETIKIRVSVPALLKRILPSKERVIDLDVADLSGMEHILCRVSFDKTPIRLEASATPSEPRKALRSWREVAEKTFDRHLGEQDAAKKDPSIGTEAD